VINKRPGVNKLGLCNVHGTPHALSDAVRIVLQKARCPLVRALAGVAVAAGPQHCDNCIARGRNRAARGKTRRTCLSARPSSMSRISPRIAISALTMRSSSCLDSLSVGSIMSVPARGPPYTSETHHTTPQLSVAAAWSVQDCRELHAPVPWGLLPNMQPGHSRTGAKCAGVRASGYVDRQVMTGGWDTVDGPGHGGRSGRHTQGFKLLLRV
jgi:hypothetical protein